MLPFPLQSFFVALPLTGQAKERFGECQGLLSEYADILRFQNPETPHLTLKYWKIIDEPFYVRVLEDCRMIAATERAFSLRISGADTFDQHTLFLSIVPSPKLDSLRLRCPWEDRRFFHPHITIARITDPKLFSLSRDEILRRLSVTSEMTVDRLGLFATIDRKRQTLLKEFLFG